MLPRIIHAKDLTSSTVRHRNRVAEQETVTEKELVLTCINLEDSD